MTHPDHTQDPKAAPITPPTVEDTSTTRELPAHAPKHPALTRALMVAQAILVIGGIALAATNTSRVGAAALLVIALAAILLTWHGWGWFTRYPGARLLSNSKLDTLQPGAWIVTPGSKYAVVVWDQPHGPRNNPSIADGLTWDELQIIAPVYKFTQPPKGSMPS